MTTIHNGKRLTRNYSQLKISAKQIYSGDQTIYSVKTAKRKVSYDASKTIKPSDRHSKYEDLKLMNNCQYKLSTEVLSFQMEEQRNREMRTINSNHQLSAYYECFKKIFMALYQASSVVLDNPFKAGKDKFQKGQLQLIPVLIMCAKNEWEIENVYRLQTLARNIALFSSCPNEFQRRIDQVARKVSLHNTKRISIQNAFLNPKITTYWKRIQQKFSELPVYSYLQDQFESAESKLCFIEVQHFVQNQLCEQEFGNKIRKYCWLQQIDEDMNFDFKFQFLLTQELCFNSLDDLLRVDEQRQNTQTCNII